MSAFRTEDREFHVDSGLLASTPTFGEINPLRRTDDYGHTVYSAVSSMAVSTAKLNA